MILCNTLWICIILVWALQYVLLRIYRFIESITHGYIWHKIIDFPKFNTNARTASISSSQTLSIMIDGLNDWVMYVWFLGFTLILLLNLRVPGERSLSVKRYLPVTQLQCERFPSSGQHKSFCLWGRPSQSHKHPEIIGSIANYIEIQPIKNTNKINSF